MSGNSTSTSAASSPSPTTFSDSPSTSAPSSSTTADTSPPTVTSVSTSPSTSLEPSTSSSIELASSLLPTSSIPTPTTASAPPVTSTPVQTTIQALTSTTITVSPSDRNGQSQSPIVVIQTSTEPAPTPTSQTTSSTPTSSSTAAPSLNDGTSKSGSGGLTGAGRTAVAVVVPIVGVAIIALLGLWFWRKRKQRKDAEELRRKEVEEYGFNPNTDPTLPAIGLASGGAGQDGPFPMREEGSGYRGWGTTTLAGSSATRKASTTLSGGAAGARAYSEGTSPSQGPISSDTRSGDPLVRSPTAPPDSSESEPLGAMGPAAAANRNDDMHRGISNASSSYSAANRSDGSGEQPAPGNPFNATQYYTSDGPYADPGYGGRGAPAEVSGQPVIRDNLARRATRIENPSHFPTQASAGISQNF